MKVNPQLITELEGELYLFTRIANEMRLDCQRRGFAAEAQAIKMMQDNLRTLGRIRYEAEKGTKCQKSSCVLENI